MARVEKIPADSPTVDELEKYQRLVELQKQIIALAQQNERAQQACVELREQVATAIFSQTGTQRNLRQKTTRNLRRLPGLSLAKSDWSSFLIKEQPAS